MNSCLKMLNSGICQKYSYLAMMEEISIQCMFHAWCWFSGTTISARTRKREQFLAETLLSSEILQRYLLCNLVLRRTVCMTKEFRASIVFLHSGTFRLILVADEACKGERLTRGKICSHIG
ncbi:hypothetical protein ACS0TY_032135 [Phlomoides rotata]